MVSQERTTVPGCRPFVILDRDGVVIVDKHYLSDPMDVELLPGVTRSLACIRELGMGAVIVTNQSGIGRGFFDEEQLRAVHARLLELLQADGVNVDGIYYCPHAPDDGCVCRKPETGLVLQAAEVHGFLPAACYVVGDRRSDIDLGRAVGATTFLTTQGYGHQFVDDPETRPDFVVSGLPEAVAIIESLA